MADNPITLYATAKGYVQASYLMMTNHLRLSQLRDDTSLVLPFYLLCGFAVELYFKSFATNAGVLDKDLRKIDVRHDLFRLRELCVERGLIDGGSESLVKALSKQHKSFAYRYAPEDENYLCYNLQQLFKALSDLDRSVDISIGASKSYGSALGSGWTFPDDGPWRLPSP